MRAIHLRFGLSAVTPARLKTAIKAADAAAAFHEATRLAGFSADEARKFFGAPTIAADALPFEPMSAPQAQAAFLARFIELEVLIGK